MKDLPFDMWEPIIGLEVHVQLNTKSKLFSSAPNRFGDEPNTNISNFCTGQPGTLPTINKEAIKKAVSFGLAINSSIQKFSSFDRKSYFYPDCPRNFQITQFDHPIIIGGTIIADVEGETKEFEVDRAHLEDDAGMLKHFSSFAGVDYNRAGAPLLEVVSKPIIYSSKEAAAYVMALKAIMEYIGASDCNMEEGNLRVDANISVRPKGEKNLRNKIEIKNMNSFSFLQMAIDSEITRQIALYTQNPHEDPKKLIVSGTYKWDSDKKQAILMRQKESEGDYRYFPEPDLPPLILSDEYIDKIKKNIPELPHERFNRYVSKLKLSSYNASLLVNDKNLSNYFEEACKFCSNAKPLCNWITVEFIGKVKEKNTTLFKLNLPAKNIAMLVNLIEDGTVTGKIAKEIADIMIEHPNKSPNIIIKENPDFRPINNEDIEPLVDKVLKENPQSIIDFKNGKDRAFGFLVGQVMKLSKGKANPKIVNDLLNKKLNN
jgi:aspartyl-tRNA(Asn)/glutamyl-tRNA(Gln) amidotransferase subunit B